MQITVTAITEPIISVVGKGSVIGVFDVSTLNGTVALKFPVKPLIVVSP
jgi:hypothetical protein